MVGDVAAEAGRSHSFRAAEKEFGLRSGLNPNAVFMATQQKHRFRNRNLLVSAFSTDFYNTFFLFETGIHTLILFFIAITAYKVCIQTMEDFNRNLIISIVCGIVFGVSWWIMIDIMAYYPEVSSYKQGLLYLPVFLSTLSLFLNAVVPNSSLVENYTVTRIIFAHRMLFFFSMSLGFAGILTSIIICVLKSATSLPTYALVGIPVLNILILIANVTFKFGVVDEEEDFI